MFRYPHQITPRRRWSFSRRGDVGLDDSHPCKLALHDVTLSRLKGSTGAGARQRIPDNLKYQKRSKFSNFGEFGVFFFCHFWSFFAVVSHFRPFWVILAICALAKTWGPRGRRQRMTQHPPTNPISLTLPLPNTSPSTHKISQSVPLSSYPANGYQPLHLSQLYPHTMNLHNILCLLRYAALATSQVSAAGVLVPSHSALNFSFRPPL